FEQPVWLTRLPSFVEKALHFPQATFVVGIDTLIRICAPRYYDSITSRDLALAQLADQAVRFLVFGRVDDGEFMHLEHYDLPQKFVDLCSVVTQAEFRADVSSSAIRAELQTNANN
ncbi:MAG: hypothetical protein O3A63_17245, partial [Proteobacteria bacterium]|nr:hypothetical protein [Pseudomonadota bacterium]